MDKLLLAIAAAAAILVATVAIAAELSGAGLAIGIIVGMKIVVYLISAIAFLVAVGAVIGGFI